jgi:hypothetical protein
MIVGGSRWTRPAESGAPGSVSRLSLDTANGERGAGDELLGIVGWHVPAMVGWDGVIGTAG